MERQGRSTGNHRSVFAVVGLQSALAGLAVTVAFGDGHQPTEWRRVDPPSESPHWTDEDALTFTNGKFFSKGTEFLFESADGEDWIKFARTWTTMDRDQVYFVDRILPYPDAVVVSYSNVSDGTDDFLLTRLDTFDGQQGFIEDFLGGLEVVWIEGIGGEAFGTGFVTYHPNNLNEAQWAGNGSGQIAALVRVDPDEPPVLRFYDGGSWQAVDFGPVLTGGSLVWDGSRFLLSLSDGVWESTEGESWTPGAVDMAPFAGAAPRFVPGAGGVLYEATQGLVSADGGESWIASNDPPSTAAFHETRYGNGAWVTVGFGGTLASSSDGIDWVHHDLADLESNLIDAAYGNGRWVVIGEDTVIISEVDEFVPPAAIPVPPLTLSRDLVLSFPTEPGFTYTIATGNLAGWEERQSVTGDGTEVQYQLPNEANGFARVSVE